MTPFETLLYLSSSSKRIVYTPDDPISGKREGKGNDQSTVRPRGEEGPARYGNGEKKPTCSSLGLSLQLILLSLCTRGICPESDTPSGPRNGLFRQQKRNLRVLHQSSHQIALLKDMTSWRSYPGPFSWLVGPGRKKS